MTGNLVHIVDVPEHRPWATVRFLRRLVYEGRIAYFKVGGKVLLDLDDLDAYVEAGRREPNAA